MRWPRIAVAALVLANLTAGGGIVAIRARDRPMPVPLDRAIDRYRASVPVPTTTASAIDMSPEASQTTPSEVSADGSSASAPTTTVSTTVAGRVDAARSEETATPSGGGRGRQPKLGVYVYDTDGWEETDALGGARHEYPATTTITVQSGGCGVTARWDVLEDRSEEVERCPALDGGESVAGFVSRHGFYGRRDERSFRCDPGSVYRPPPATPAGTAWTYRCRSAATTATNTVTIVAYETVTVSGTPVKAVHLRQIGKPGGDTAGSMQRELWLSVHDGVLLRERGMVESQTSEGAITANYREQYELRLTSLDPKR